MNKLLDFLSAIILFVNTFLVIFYSYKLLNEKRNITFRNVLIVLIGSVLIYFKNSFDIPFKTISNLLLIAAIFYLLDKKKVVNLFLSYGIINFIGLCIELIIFLQIELFTEVDCFDMSDEFAIFLSISLLLIWFSTIDLLLKKLNFILNFFVSLINKHMKGEYIFLLFSIILNLMLFYFYFENANSITIIIYILCMNLIVVLLSFVFRARNKKIQLEENIDQLTSVLNEYDKVAEEYRILKHNLISDFILIKSTPEESKEKVINQMITIYKKDYEWINSITKLPNGLQGLIYMKSIVAKKAKVKYIFNCDKKRDFSKILPTKDYNYLCKILNIVIDNAIEAATETKEKFIYINILDSTITISNPFINAIDLEKIYSSSYSSKGDSRGLGLYSIKKGSKFIKMKPKIINNVFITEIEVK